MWKSLVLSCGIAVGAPAQELGAEREWDTILAGCVRTVEGIEALRAEQTRVTVEIYGREREARNAGYVLPDLLEALARRERDAKAPLVDLTIGYYQSKGPRMMPDVHLDLRALERLAKLRTLTINSGDLVTVELLRRLSTLLDLRELRLGTCRLDGGQLRTLAAFPALRHLELQNPSALDSLAFLDGMPRLESFTLLLLPTIERPDLAPIWRLRELRKLSLWGEMLNDQHMEHLATLDKLEDLRIPSQRDVTHAGLARLERLPRLRALDVSWWSKAKWDRRLMRHLPTRVRRLMASGTRLRIEDLERLRDLRFLECRETKVRRVDWPRFSWETVESLTIGAWRFEIPDSCFERAKHLKSCRLSGGVHATGR